MIVINACINQISGLRRVEAEKFRKELKTMQIEKYVDVHTIPKFLEALENYKDQEILLFSNFSPNYFFTKNSIDVNDYQEKTLPDWPVNEYAFSAGLYHRICREYPLLGIHFITAANSLMVPNSLFLSITGNVSTTIKRKQDWTKPGMIYQAFLKQYLLKKIREAQNINND